MQKESFENLKNKLMDVFGSNTNYRERKIVERVIEIAKKKSSIDSIVKTIEKDLEIMKVIRHKKYDFFAVIDKCCDFDHSISVESNERSTGFNYRKHIEEQSDDEEIKEYDNRNRRRQRSTSIDSPEKRLKHDNRFERKSLGAPQRSNALNAALQNQHGQNPNDSSKFTPKPYPHNMPKKPLPPGYSKKGNFDAVGSNYPKNPINIEQNPQEYDFEANMLEKRQRLDSAHSLKATPFKAGVPPPPAIQRKIKPFPKKDKLSKYETRKDCIVVKSIPSYYNIVNYLSNYFQKFGAIANISTHTDIKCSVIQYTSEDSAKKVMESSQIPFDLDTIELYCAGEKKEVKVQVQPEAPQTKTYTPNYDQAQQGQLIQHGPPQLHRYHYKGNYQPESYGRGGYYQHPRYPASYAPTQAQGQYQHYSGEVAEYPAPAPGQGSTLDLNGSKHNLEEKKNNWRLLQEGKQAILQRLTTFVQLFLELKMSRTTQQDKNKVQDLIKETNSKMARVGQCKDLAVLNREFSDLDRQPLDITLNISSEKEFEYRQLQNYLQTYGKLKKLIIDDDNLAEVEFYQIGSAFRAYFDLRKNSEYTMKFLDRELHGVVCFVEGIDPETEEPAGKKYGESQDSINQDEASLLAKTRPDQRHASNLESHKNIQNKSNINQSTNKTGEDELRLPKTELLALSQDGQKNLEFGELPSSSNQLDISVTISEKMPSSQDHKRNHTQEDNQMLEQKMQPQPIHQSSMVEAVLDSEKEMKNEGDCD